MSDLMQETAEEAAYFEAAEQAETEPTSETVEAGEPEPGSEPAEEGAEQQAGAETEEGGEGAEPRLVPYGALHEERERRKELQAEVAEFRDKWARADERLKQIMDAMERRSKQEQAPKEEAIPDVDADPVAHLQARLERTEAALAEARKQQEGAQQTSQRQADENQFQTAVASAEDAFRAQHPDYEAAIDHVRTDRLRYYQAMGYPPEAAHRFTAMEARSAAIDALKAGRSPAETLYKLAQHLGYKPADGGGAQDGNGQGNGKVAELAERQGRAGPSLGAGGTSPKGKVTLEDLDKMPDDQFDKFFEQVFAD